MAGVSSLSGNVEGKPIFGFSCVFLRPERIGLGPDGLDWGRTNCSGNKAPQQKSFSS